MANTPEVTVAVVTWNSATHIEALMASLPAALSGVRSWRLVFIDNASSDGTVEAVRRHTPPALVVELGRNAGYAAGINAAWRACPPSNALLALNPDVRLRPDCVHHLRAALGEPGVGITVPRLHDEDGALQLSLRREPTALRVWGEALMGGMRAGRIGAVGEVVVDGRHYERPAAADWATGAAMLVSKACFEALGGFDESFFLYSEETDFCLRARDAGFRLRYVPTAVATHHGGESNTSPPLYALLTRNRMRLFSRRHGRVRAGAFWCGLATGEVLRAPLGATHRAALRALLTR